MNKHSATSFEALFERLFETTGALEEFKGRALKKGFADTMRARMTELGLSKQELARKIATSRTQLNRILDPDDTSITLMTMVRIGGALGVDTRFDFAPPRARARRSRPPASTKRKK